MGLLHDPFGPYPMLFVAFMAVVIAGAFVTRHIIEHRGIDCNRPIRFRIDRNNTRVNNIESGQHGKGSRYKDSEAMENNKPPSVRLPQGTYEGSVVVVGQNVVESAGLGLGVGSDGDAQSPGPIPGSLPIPRQMALPKNLDVFLGIPFAQPTSGNNRFRSPVPLDVDPRAVSGAVTVPIPATRLGQRCPGTAPNPFVPEGEDCLNLNVYRPSKQVAESVGSATSSLLPVVIYVHGGGFNNGMGVERDMASFVGYAESGVIGVSFNYRVGALGFLGWVESDSDAPLNLGLRDQQALFYWVQKNIVHFGGDPNNVTIMGLSAGAHSIGHHLMYYQPGGPVEAPFHKAILESGGPTARAVWDKSHPRPTAQLRDFLVAAGIFGGDDNAPEAATPLSLASAINGEVSKSGHARLSEQEILSRLRELPLEVIVNASRKVWNDYSASVCWPFQPVVDGDVIPRLPVDSWRSRLHPNLPPSPIAILTGFNSNEGTMFVPGDVVRADTDEHFRNFFMGLVPGLTSSDLDELAGVYPDPVTDPSSPYRMPKGAFPPGVSGRQWARLEAAYAHYAYICPVLQTAHYSSASGAKVWLYEYAAHATGWNTANHGDNQSAVAHSMSVLRGNPGLLAVADAMNAAWVRFAATGDPNGSGDGNVAGINWKPFGSPFTTARTQDEDALMVFGEGNNERVPPDQRTGSPQPNPGTPAALRVLSEYELAQCRFWWDRIELSQGSGRQNEVSAARKQRPVNSLL